MFSCVLAVLCDALLGEPPNSFHPTVWMGRGVSLLERLLYKKDGLEAKLRGCLLVALACLAVAVPAQLLQSAIFRLLPGGWAWLACAAVASLAIAPNSLMRHAMPVFKALRGFNTPLARERVAMIVGRDAKALGRGEVSRAAVEAVAESLGDGVLAPLFWFAVFGLPGAFVYRVSNTMDSMLGHKDERYLRLGWAAARFDDLLNFFPTRILAVPAIAASAFAVSGLRAARESLRAAWLFHSAHKSPNAGWYESAFAGALGIRLGGVNFYDGEMVESPVMNSAGRQAKAGDIALSVKLMLWAAALSAIALDLAGFLLGFLLRGF